MAKKLLTISFSRILRISAALVLAVQLFAGAGRYYRYKHCPHRKISYSVTDFQLHSLQQRDDFYIATDSDSQLVMVVDGEIQVNFAMNRELRDKKYPFTRLFGKDVNTLVFPNLSSANATYQMLQAMSGDDMEIIGPIQLGLNKPIHFTDFESSVRDIVNITAVAVIDAIVAKKLCDNIACEAEK